MTDKALVGLARELHEARAKYLELADRVHGEEPGEEWNFDDLTLARNRYRAALAAWNAQCPPDPPKPPKGLRWVRLKPEA